MPKPVKNQWDFGELFPPESLRKVWSVSEFTGNIKRQLEKQYGQIWISGEVSNLRAQSSGHLYFTIKDSAAQLQCVLFRGEVVAHRDALKDGQKVILSGDITVYEPRGQYQLRISGIELQGIGALQLAFEKLKQKLQAEGLFTSAHKRRMPMYPHRIGVVTSLSGAAIRDVLHVIERRSPGLEIVIAACRVQGEGASAEIARSINLLNHWSCLGKMAVIDLILITRGGGSIEDLWAFNEEVVARAIYNSAIPVISAVGHEIDFTISDFVADLRAATPSAAAELISEGIYASRQFILDVPRRLIELTHQRIDRKQEQFVNLHRRFLRVHPIRLINDKSQRVDDLKESLVRLLRLRWKETAFRWKTLQHRLNRLQPNRVLKRQVERKNGLHLRLTSAFHSQLESLKHCFNQAHQRLMLLAPDQILKRGYSITLDAKTGKILRDASLIGSGQKIVTQLYQGQIESTVTSNSPAPDKSTENLGR